MKKCGGKNGFCSLFRRYKCNSAEIGRLKCRDVVLHIKSIRLFYWFQLTFDWNDELRDYWQDLRTPMLQHIVDTLSGKELTRMSHFTQAIEKQWQVVMVI